MPTKPKTTIEDSLGQIEKLLERLETPSADLAGQLEAFEAGIALSKSCLKQLEEVESRIVLLTEGKDGSPTSTDFAPDPT